MGKAHEPASEVRPARGEPSPTPIRISTRNRTVLLVLGIVALALLMWFAPSVPVTVLGGFAVALALSFPVRWLSRLMPCGLAILTTFLVLIGLVVFALLFLVPILISQLVSLINAAPAVARDARGTLLGVLQPLAERGLLQGTPDEFMARPGRDLVGLAQDLGRQILVGLVSFISGAFGLAISLIAMLFVAIYLRAAPKRYRRDARRLWDAFAFSLSRYLSGLAFVMLIQGALSAVALFLLGVPYVLLLGAWVSLTAMIPYLGAWLGAVPAVVLAFTVSPTTAVLTALVFLVIQQLEGNVLTPAYRERPSTCLPS